MKSFKLTKLAIGTITVEISGVEYKADSDEEKLDLIDLPEDAIFSKITGDVEFVLQIESDLKMPHDCSSFFRDFKILNSVKLNTSDTTNMKFMFYRCEGMKSPPIGFDTSKVTDMRCMFQGCKNMKSPLIGFNTSKVTDMRCMFYECESMTSPPSKFDTSNVENMSFMFFGCKNIITPPLGFNTSKVTDMRCMFYRCENMKTPPVGFKTTKVTDMRSMFYECENMETPPVAFDTLIVTDMSCMFYKCENMKTPPIGFKTANVENMISMFFGCKSMTSPPFGFDTSKANTTYMFKNCFFFKQKLEFAYSREKVETAVSNYFNLISLEDEEDISLSERIIVNPENKAFGANSEFFDPKYLKTVEIDEIEYAIFNCLPSGGFAIPSANFSEMIRSGDKIVKIKRLGEDKISDYPLAIFVGIIE